MTQPHNDYICVKDFGAVGDGVTDDTVAINAAISGRQNTQIFFPPGTYLYAGGAWVDHGTILVGASRDATIIKATQSSSNLITCAGLYSGVRNMGISSTVPQTGGAYVTLLGTYSFIDDYDLEGAFRGIVMIGVATRVRHGRHLASRPNAIGITSTGGDCSQSIFDVIMGAEDPANVARAGIYLTNSCALVISNCSIIQQGVGLLIETNSISNSVFSVKSNNNFFDNNTRAMQVVASGTGVVQRCTSSSDWFGSSTLDGIQFIQTGASDISGYRFIAPEILLSGGCGISSNGAVNDLQIVGGGISANLQHGIYFAPGTRGVVLSGVTIGQGQGLLGNSLHGVVFSGGTRDVTMTGCRVMGNGGVPVVDGAASKQIVGCLPASINAVG